jgi:hypothetical protein
MACSLWRRLCRWLVRRQVKFKPRNCCANDFGGWCGKRVRIRYMGVCWSNFRWCQYESTRTHGQTHELLVTSSIPDASSFYINAGRGALAIWPLAHEALMHSCSSFHMWSMVFPLVYVITYRNRHTWNFIDYTVNRKPVDPIEKKKYKSTMQKQCSANYYCYVLILHFMN